AMRPFWPPISDSLLQRRRRWLPPDRSDRRTISKRLQCPPSSLAHFQAPGAAGPSDRRRKSVQGKTLTAVDLHLLNRRFQIASFGTTIAATFWRLKPRGGVTWPASRECNPRRLAGQPAWSTGLCGEKCGRLPARTGWENRSRSRLTIHG